jgi:16S rRNA processing protein RimM
MAAYGIRGEVKVKVFTEAPEGIAAYGPLSTATGHVLRVLSVRAGKPGEAVLRFEGIADRGAAEALKGEGLYVARAALPEPEMGEFYLADLVGLRAQTREGALFGRVTGVHDFGAGPVLEIANPDGETQYLPFSNDVVPEVDLVGARIIVAPPTETE